MRKAYKMRQVVRSWERELPGYPGVIVPMHTLECGHSIRQEVVESASRAFGVMMHRLDPKAPYRRRCFRCAAPYPPMMRAADLGLPIYWPQTRAEYHYANGNTRDGDLMERRQAITDCRSPEPGADVDDLRRHLHIDFGARDGEGDG